MKKTSCKISVLVLTCLTTLSASGTGLINGGFEAIPVSVPTSYFVAPAGFGWTVVSNDIDILPSTYWQPSGGNQSIDLNGGSPSSIYQDFNFSSAGTWTVKFDLSSNPDLFSRGDGLGTGFKNLRVDFGPIGSLTSLGTYSLDSAPRTVSNMQWVTFTTPQIIVSDSVLYRLQFTSLVPGIAGNALDNIQLQVVPEPSTIALLSSSLIGFCIYRRRNNYKV